MNRSGKKKNRRANQSRQGVASRVRNLVKRAGGQSVAEFAMVLPVFLMLVMGMLDMARAYGALQVVTNAAREGARVGIIPATAPPAVTTFVNNYLTAGGQAGCASAGANWGTAGAAGANTTVQVTCNFQTMTGTIVPGWTGTIALSRTATMRHE